MHYLSNMSDAKPGPKNMDLLKQQYQRLNDIVRDFDFVVMELVDELSQGDPDDDDAMDAILDNPYVAWLYAVNGSAEKLMRKAEELKIND